MKRRKSIRAYDVPERVASYDVDMDIMHPHRSTMVEVALEVLPFGADTPIRGLDIGSGTGYFSRCFLDAFPKAKVVAIDGADAMIDLAKERLGPLAGLVDFRVGDFCDLADLTKDLGNIDVVFSSYALHHLDPTDKSTVVKAALSLLRPGGWFLNADLIVGDNDEAERRFQELRLQGIVERAKSAKSRYADRETTRRFLDELEASEGDQPLTLAEDLELLRNAGLTKATVFWLEYREAVSGGMHAP